MDLSRWAWSRPYGKAAFAGVGAVVLLTVNYARISASTHDGAFPAVPACDMIAAGEPPRLIPDAVERPGCAWRSPDGTSRALRLTSTRYAREIEGFVHGRSGPVVAHLAMRKARREATGQVEDAPPVGDEAFTVMRSEPAGVAVDLYFRVSNLVVSLRYVRNGHHLDPHDARDDLVGSASGMADAVTI